MILIVDCGSIKSPEIKRMVENAGYSTEYIPQNELALKEAEGYKGIIISGAPILLSQTDPLPFLRRFEFIRTLEIPILGICFGHQVIGMLYGAKISIGKPIEGNESIRLLQKDKIFQGLPEITNFEQDHREHISLPNGFTHLATSESSNVEAIKHPDKEIYGVQFHPEVSGKNGQLVFNNFCKTCC